MALVYFQKKITIDQAIAPEPGGYVIAYDQDGLLKQKDSDGNVTEVGGGITITDFISGIEYAGVRNITFRGGSVTTPNGTSNAVSLQGDSSNLEVWIPAPQYVDNFEPVLYSDYSPRYVSNPTNNIQTISIESGNFSIGDWDVASDIGNVSRNVINIGGVINAFEDIEFSCKSDTTDITFSVYDGSNQLISRIENFLLDSVTVENNGFIIIEVNSFDNDSDRFKASVIGKIDLDSLFPNGGRFYWEVTHNNDSIGTFTYISDVMFKDSPIDQDGLSSTSEIVGLVEFEELLPVITSYSGVEFYTTDTTFDVNVSDIVNINQISMPIDKQIDITNENMPITSTHEGIGTDLTGWSIDWDSNNLIYTVEARVDDVNVFKPDFDILNSIITTPTSKFISNIYDYGLADSKDSNTELMLFDTGVQSVDDNLTNALRSENKRLSTSGVLIDGSELFDSTIPLENEELQFIFGRVIYPNQDFSQFYPSGNLVNNNIDYTNSDGSNLFLDVYNDTDNGTFDSITFIDYRWFTTSYEKSSSFSNGIFTLNSNFEENDLHYNGVNSTAGNEDLILLVGIDSSGNNNTPDRFLFVSGNPNTNPTRQNSITYNFNKTDSSKDIQFSKGTLSVVVRKVWLMVGYKNSARGKELRLSNINLQ